MNSLYKSSKASLPFEITVVKLFFAFARLVLVLLVLGFAVAKASAQELVFQDPVLFSGAAGQNGATYKFANVIAGVDALVKIKDRSSADVVLQDIDVEETGWNKAFQPQLGRTGNVLGIANWWMEFEIDFVKTGTTQSAEVNKFDLTALDVDGDGLTIQEYVEFYKTKHTAVENVSQLFATLIAQSNSGPGSTNEKDYRLQGPIANFLNIDTAGTSVMATGKYEKKSKIKVRIGARAMGLGVSNAGMRYNSLWFRSFAYQAPRTLPVNLTGFNVSMINKKISVSWGTSIEKNASHFVVQRSTDGVEFTDAGIIFTEGNYTDSRTYSFKDPISTNGKGVLYYRLKIVDMDGQFEISAIRMVKLGESDGRLELQAFPNPVVNELRITIPESWQNRQVVYEVYTGDGQLMKRFLNKSATQTEIIDMQGYQPGMYVIKALNEKEIASQRIIKRR